MYVIPRPTKTYFYTDKVENRFPSEFIQSKNKRQIKVLSCKLKYKDFLVGDVKVHASFIERDHYDDYFCIMANSNNGIPKKYDYTSFRQDFKIWFTDLEGNEIKADENLSFILELVLIY